MGGTSIPIILASVVIENSFSGTPANCWEGSLTIHDPPTPSVGIVRPPPLPSLLSAENVSCTPASENRYAFGFVFPGSVSSADGGTGKWRVDIEK
jgi:hypothetical protein